MREICICLLIFYLYSPVLGLCPFQTFENNGTCSQCAMYCLSCSDSLTCQKCEPEFFLLNGSCFAKCTYPYYPFLQDQQTLECRVIDHLNIFTSKMILEDFKSEQKNQSLYLNLLSNLHESFELSLWIYFESLGEPEQEKEFLIISSLFAPYEFLSNKPYIVKLGLKERTLVGPTELNYAQKEIETNKWLLLVINFEKDFKQELFNVGILIFDFENASNMLYSKIKTYASSSVLKKRVIFHFGNLKNSLNFKFMAKEVKITLLGCPSIYHGGNLNLDQLSINNQPAINANFFNDTSFKMSVPEEFKSKFLYFEFKFIKGAFPCSVFRMSTHERKIYELDLVLHDGSVYIKANDVLFPLDEEKNIIRLHFINFGGEILFVDDYKIKNLSRIQHLDLNLFSSSENCMINPIKIFAADNPQIAILSRDFGITTNTKSLSSINFFDPTTMVNFLENKTCENNPKLHYFLSKSDCSEEIRHACIKKIPDCDVCYNSTYCLICRQNFSLFQGDCLQNCSGKLKTNHPRYPLSVCIECESHGFFLDENKNCVNCEDFFFNCSLTNDSKVCSDEMSRRNCSAFSALDYLYPCPSNCGVCEFIKGHLQCKSCLGLNVLYNNTCLEKCPTGFFEYQSNCFELSSCDPKLSFLFEGHCINYTHIGGFYNHTYLILPCLDGFVTINNTCINTSRQDICIQEGPRWCEYMPHDVNSDEVMLDPIYPDSIPEMMMMKHMLMILVGTELRLDCPDNLDYNESEENNPCQKIIKFRRKVEENYERLTSLNLTFTRRKKYLNRLCPNYLEGFHIIYINDTCLLVPTTHLIFLNGQYLYTSPISIKHSMRIDDIIITDNKTLHGTIANKILLLNVCPQRYLANSNNRCIYCGSSCVTCKDLDPACLEQNISDLYQEAPYFDLFGEMIHSFDNNISKGLDFSKSAITKCPKTCKVCYSTGEIVFCAECISKHMKIRDKRYCQCDNDFVFDHSSQKCVEKCPDGLVLKTKECLKNCNEISSSGLIRRFSAQTFRHQDRCLEMCPESTYPTIEFDFFQDVVCIDHDFYREWSFFSQSSNKSANIMRNLTEKLWRNGFLQMIKSQEISIFIEFFENLDLFSEEGLSKIIDTFSYFQTFRMSHEQIQKILDIISEIIRKTHSINLLLKVHYMLQMSKFQNIEKYQVKNITKTSFNLWDNPFSYTAISKFKFSINFGMDTRTVIDFVEIIRQDETSISFKLYQESPIIDELMKLQFESDPDFDFKVYFGNYTSNHLQKITNQDSKILYPSCIYFVYIIHDDKEMNEIINPMIEHDLLYGRSNIENIWARQHERNRDGYQIYLILFFCILGVLLFLILFFLFLKNKILKPSRVKFVQMVDLDSDEEEQQVYEND